MATVESRDDAERVVLERAAFLLVDSTKSAWLSGAELRSQCELSLDILKKNGVPGKPCLLYTSDAADDYFWV